MSDYCCGCGKDACVEPTCGEDCCEFCGRYGNCVCSDDGADAAYAEHTAWIV